MGIPEHSRPAPEVELDVRIHQGLGLSRIGVMRDGADHGEKRFLRKILRGPSKTCAQHASRMQEQTKSNALTDCRACHRATAGTLA